MRGKRHMGVKASMMMMVGGFLLGSSCMPNDLLFETWASTLNAVADAVVVTPVVNAVAGVTAP